MLIPKWALWLNPVGVLLEFVGVWLALYPSAAGWLHVRLGRSDAPKGAFWEWLYDWLGDCVKFDKRRAMNEWRHVVVGFVVSVVGVALQLVVVVVQLVAGG